MSPPFSVCYDLNKSPVLYIGSGHIGQRWSMHRDWLYEIGETLPWLRYEVWVCIPRAQNNPTVHEDVEAEILKRFQKKYQTLPLRNQKIQNPRLSHVYADNFFSEIFEFKDGRYRWALYPTKGKPSEYYNRGWME
jgi:hypothetical protein